MKRSRRWLRTLLPLALLTGLLAGLAGPRVMRGSAAPLEQVSTTVVISEFRTRGPASPGDATGDNNEFIEIYNLTGFPIDIGGWTVRTYSSVTVTETTLVTFPTGTNLSANTHRLIVNAAAEARLVSAAESTYTGLITDNAGIGLFDGSGTRIDSVSLSSANVDYLEGTPLAPMSPLTDQSYQRSGTGGSTDTGDNFADFALISPSEPDSGGGAVATATLTPTVTLTPTGASPTPTLTPTPSHTLTPSHTPPPRTPTLTPIPGFLSVVINEVAWSGTRYDLDHEWIELYNPTSRAIDLTGWYIQVTSFDLLIMLDSKIIPAGGFYLLERFEEATSVQSQQVDEWELLEDDFEILTLFAPDNRLIDQTYATRNQWPAGSTTNTRSMERRTVTSTSSLWVTYAGTHVSTDPRDPGNNFINGTPGRANWNLSVTLTPSATPTRFTTKVPTRTKPPQPRPVINEFLPRASFDWNQDGRVDVFDEFVEVANVGPADWNTNGWRLDTGEDSEAVPLPSMTIKPGGRALFYGLQSGLRLTDGGATLRLLNGGVVWDAQTYSVVKTPDQSWCRIRDLSGSWFEDCFPTPNQPNQREGKLPASPPGTGLETPLCRLADTLPEEFILAECLAFGDAMWNSRYWDEAGWLGERFVRQNGSKWESFIE